MDPISTLDLISGPFPTVVAILAAMSGVVLLLRRSRTWLLQVPGAALVAGALAVLANWFAVNVAAISAYDLPWPVIAWVGGGFFAVLLMILQLVWGRSWRRVLAPMAAVLVLAAAAMQVNAYYGAFRTVGDITGASTANIAPLPASAEISQAGHGLAARTSGPVVDGWVKPAGLPLVGTVSSVHIPGSVSGFTGRTGFVYLPPAYQAPKRPLLPVLILIPGQPGSPADWIKAGRLQQSMDAFAAAHQGLAPVVVVPDVNGATAANTMCMDSRIAKAGTYLSVDVPAWVKKTLAVDPNSQHWAVGGFSFGGTCALQMATLHPKEFPSAIDLSGEEEPALSADRSATIAAAFGGDTAAFDALIPMALMAKNHYPDSHIYFAAGAQDDRFTGYMNRVSAAAKAAGMTVTTQSAPGAGHSWEVPVTALPQALDWLAPRLGLAH